MAGIFGILYLLLIIIYMIMALFVVYHIVRFSFHKSVTALTLVIFISVFMFLLFSNLTLFLAVKWEKVFSLF